MQPHLALQQLAALFQLFQLLLPLHNHAMGRSAHTAMPPAAAGPPAPAWPPPRSPADLTSVCHEGIACVRSAFHRRSNSAACDSAACHATIDTASVGLVLLTSRVVFINLISLSSFSTCQSLLSLGILYNRSHPCLHIKPFATDVLLVSFSCGSQVLHQ